MARLKENTKNDSASLNDIGAAFAGLMNVMRKGMYSGTDHTVAERQKETREHVERTRESIERGASPACKPFSI